MMMHRAKLPAFW